MPSVTLTSSWRSSTLDYHSGVQPRVFLFSPSYRSNPQIKFKGNSKEQRGRTTKQTKNKMIEKERNHRQSDRSNRIMGLLWYGRVWAHSRLILAMKGVYSAPGDYIYFKSQVPLHKIPVCSFLFYSDFSHIYVKLESLASFCYWVCFHFAITVLVSLFAINYVLSWSFYC